MKDLKSKTTNVTTYWAPLRDQKNVTVIGAIGLFSDYLRFKNCMPKIFTEGYFAPTYMMMFDQNLKIIYQWLNEFEIYGQNLLLAPLAAFNQKSILKAK